MYKRAEQNFVLSNEIDNMSLIMPSQTKQINLAKVDPSMEKKQSGMWLSKKCFQNHGI